MGVQSLGWEDLLEPEVATYSNMIAWKIPTVHGPLKEWDMTEHERTQF